MSIDERDRRTAAGSREGVQRAPRSGGRTTEQRSTEATTRRTPASATGSAGGARGVRHYPTQGATALQLDAAQPVRVTEAEPKPALRVAPPAPISVPRAPFVAAMLALVVAGVFGILLINTKTNENSFQIDRLQDQKVALDTEQQELQKQLDMFEAPGNLHAAARKLGLVRGQPAYVRLPDGKIINPLIPGQGDTAITAQTGSTQTGGAQTAGNQTAGTPAGGAQTAGNQAADPAGTGTVSGAGE